MMKRINLLPLLGLTVVINVSADDALLPPNAKPGECYARVLVPPTYSTTEKQLVKKEATETIELVPAQYEWAEEKVLIKEEVEVMKVIPAKFKTVEETVMVRPATKKLVSVPAKYRTEEEKVLVRAAYTTWKKGNGLIEKVDNSTGEIMCLVEVPAEYKIVKKQVVDTAPSTEVIEIPAEYKTVKKLVIDEAARVETTKIPAEYQTVKVQKLVKEAEEKRTPVPEEHMSVVETAKTSDAYLEWRAVLCETNTTADVIRRIQQALATAGQYKGPIDGAIGNSTRAALLRYQDAKGLARGQLTTETLKSLGVSI
jgi:Putative peptidoglycan binding domain